MSSSKKPAGWFSRRHQTNEAHEAAKEAFANRAADRPRQVFVGEDHAPTSFWSKEDK